MRRRRHARRERRSPAASRSRWIRLPATTGRTAGADDDRGGDEAPDRGAGLDSQSRVGRAEPSTGIRQTPQPLRAGSLTAEQRGWGLRCVSAVATLIAGYGRPGVAAVLLLDRAVTRSSRPSALVGGACIRRGQGIPTWALLQPPGRDREDSVPPRKLLGARRRRAAAGPLGRRLDLDISVACDLLSRAAFGRSLSESSSANSASTVLLAGRPARRSWRATSPCPSPSAAGPLHSQQPQGRACGVDLAPHLGLDEARARATLGVGVPGTSTGPIPRRSTARRPTRDPRPGGPPPMLSAGRYVSL